MCTYIGRTCHTNAEEQGDRHRLSATSGRPHCAGGGDGPGGGYLVLVLLLSTVFSDYYYLYRTLAIIYNIIGLDSKRVTISVTRDVSSITWSIVYVSTVLIDIII